MSTFTANASLKYWAGSAAAVSGQARSGYYNNVPYSGHIIFSVAALGDMANVNINNIRLTLTIGSLGGAYTKDIILTRNGRDVVVGTYSRAGCRNTTVTLTWSSGTAFNDLKAYFEGLTGGKAYLGVVSHGTSRGSGGQAYDYDYLNITAAQLELTYGLRKSVGSISAASTGGNATLKITSYDSSYTHKMTWKLGSWSATTTTAAGVTTATCAIPNSALPNAVSGTATVTLETFDGSTSLGSNTYSFAVSVPSSVVPSIGSLAVTPVNSGASSTAFGWGLYIQNRTKAAATMGSVSAGSGATIRSYSITTSPNYGSGTASSLTSNLLTASGTVTFTAKVTDSRGRTATKTASITVRAYAPPVFTATPTIYRCTSNGTRDDIEGTYARLTASFSYSSVNSKNSLTVKKVVLNGATTNLTSGTAVTIGAGALAVDNSYSAVITLTDAVGSTTTFTLTVPSAAYVIHVRKGGKSVGFGMAASASNDRLDTAWPIWFSGGVTGSAAKTTRQNIGVGYAIYNNVGALGLTAGSATILAAFNAMPDNSMLVTEGAQFASSELPNSNQTGVVEIIRRNNARTHIHFYGKVAGNDWRMYEGATAYNNNESNAPTGDWVRVYDATSFVVESLSLTFSGGKATHTFSKNVNLIGCHAVANEAIIGVARTSGYTGYTFRNLTNSSYAGTLTVEVFYTTR